METRFYTSPEVDGKQAAQYYMVRPGAGVFLHALIATPGLQELRVCHTFTLPSDAQPIEPVLYYHVAHKIMERIVCFYDVATQGVTEIEPMHPLFYHQGPNKQ